MTFWNERVCGVECRGRGKRQRQRRAFAVSQTRGSWVIRGEKWVNRLLDADKQILDSRYVTLG